MRDYVDFVSFIISGSLHVLFSFSFRSVPPDRQHIFILRNSIDPPSDARFGLMPKPRYGKVITHWRPIANLDEPLWSTHPMRVLYVVPLASSKTV